MGEIRKIVWAGYKAQFEQKFKKLNGILKKMGKPTMSLRYENARDEELSFVVHTAGESHSNDAVVKRVIRMEDAVITGEPKIVKDDADYRFLGTVRFEGDVPFVFCRDEQYLPFFTEKFRKDVCDHCGTRRKRNAYYLFESEGRVLQIGSSCVNQYFGIDLNSFLLAEGALFEVLREPSYEDVCREDDFGGVPFERVVQMVDYCTDGFKFWEKGGQEGILSTVEKVRFLMDEIGFEHKGEKSVTREECIAHFEAKPESQFTFNALSALDYGFAPKRCLGIYLYAIYETARAKYAVADTAKERNGRKICNEFFGTVGGKFENPLTLEKIFTYEGQYGTAFVVRFFDDDGRKFVWFASNCPDLEDGQRVTVKGTVKKHEERNGEKQTIVTRCKIVG